MFRFFTIKNINAYYFITLFLLHSGNVTYRIVEYLIIESLISDDGIDFPIFAFFVFVFLWTVVMHLRSYCNKQAKRVVLLHEE